MLNEEQLDRIKRLQPKIIKVMGEWQDGDEYYLKALEYSNYYCDSCMNRDISNNRILRIPKPIDWQNPERGCLGMLSSFNSLECYKGKHWVCEIAKEGIKVASFGADDPFTALLKALCEQEGV